MSVFGEKVSILIHGDCEEYMRTTDLSDCVIVTDPPFNIGYHYKSYKDRIPEKEYYDWLSRVFRNAEDCPVVCVMYPEMLYRLSAVMGKFPERVISWVYPSNTRRQHRDIAFFGVKPDFSKVNQPYRNPNDKRIKTLIASGKTGANSYDWFEVNQVKNVSCQKTSHPCQMPEEVMRKVVGLLPDGLTVIDPFMGSGTTGVACKELGHKFVGIELDKEYFDIASRRLDE